MKVWEGLENLDSVEQAIKARPRDELPTDLQRLAECLGDDEKALKCLRKRQNNELAQTAPPDIS